MTKTTYPPRVEAAIANVMIKYAKWRATDETVKENKNKILSQHVFLNEDTGERITDYSCDFLLSEQDFETYLKLVYEENLKCGLDSGGWERNFWHVRKALLEAEDNFVDAISVDIPSFTPEVKERLKRSHKFREQFLKITFGDNYIV